MFKNQMAASQRGRFPFVTGERIQEVQEV